MSRFPLSGITTFSALNNPTYRLYWCFNLASSAAALIMNLARGWLVYEMTNSPFMLGAVVGAFSIPVILLAIPGGAIADRVSKRNLMIIAEAVTAFLGLSIGLLIATNLISVWHLFIASFISGIAFSFGQPAKQAIIPEIVSRDLLMNAIALGSTGFNAMRIIAPSIGGFLLAFLGMAPAYFIGTTLCVLSVIFLLFIPAKGHLEEKSKGSFSYDVLQGTRYMYQNKIIFTLFLLILVATLLAQPFQFLLPIFARDILKVGEVGLGWMMSATGSGAIIATLIIASLGNYPRKATLLLIFMGLLGLFLIVFSFSTIFAFSLLFLLILGLFATGFNTMSNAMLQIYSSMEMRGRVMSIMTIGFGIAPLGAVPLGAMAEMIGTPLSLSIGGGLVFLIALGVVIVNRAFWRLR